ncbi:MAG: hypothetical protein EON48_15935 [Acetobacteraceae bacterium]|nr:MAG: hypothetical protein EON48_15935 [Acetobacteraceae bacterium]
MIRRFACIALFASLLAACGGGPVKRVSAPAAGLQQLTVRADGSWDVQVRLDNFSSVPMTFARANIDISFDNGAAAKLKAEPGMSIGPESADVFTATVTPLPEGRARLAGALADGRSIDYTLTGTVDASAEGGGSKSYKLKRNSSLSPVPGLPGVLR